MEIPVEGYRPHQNSSQSNLHDPRKGHVKSDGFGETRGPDRLIWDVPSISNLPAASRKGSFFRNRRRRKKKKSPTAVPTDYGELPIDSKIQILSESCNGSFLNYHCIINIFWNRLRLPAIGGVELFSIFGLSVNQSYTTPDPLQHFHTLRKQLDNFHHALHCFFLPPRFCTRKKV